MPRALCGHTTTHINSTFSNLIAGDVPDECDFLFDWITLNLLHG